MDDARILGELVSSVRSLGERVSELKSDLSRHLDALENTTQRHITTIQQRQDAYDERLSALERWRSWITGVLALLGVAWSYVVSAGWLGPK